MRAADALGLWLGALRGHRSRSLMLLLAVGIGLAGSLYPAWKVLSISIANATAERR